MLINDTPPVFSRHYNTQAAICSGTGAIMLYLIIIGVIILMLFYLFKGNLAKPKIDPQNPEQKAQMF